MGNIANLINNIKTAIFGKDVRKSICDAIEQCYDDAIANGHTDMEVAKARGTYSDLNDRLNSADSRIKGLASGSPLVASSISEMTDTSKTYVNTSDGKWYYYNGSNWCVGGIYQSTGIANNSINEYKLNENLKNTLFKKIGTKNIFGENYEITNYNSGSTTVTQSNKFKSILVQIKPNTTYIIKKLKTVADRFVITLLPSYPVYEGPVSQRLTTHYNNNLTNETFGYVTTGNNDKYLLFYFYKTDDNQDDYVDILNSLECYNIENYSIEKGYPIYNNELINKKISDIENMILNTKGTDNIFNPFDLNQYANIIPSVTDNFYVLASTLSSIILPLKPNTKYTIKRKIIGQRFSYSLCNEYPFAMHSLYYNNTQNNSGDTLVINNTNFKCAVIYFYYYNDAVDFDVMAKSISIYEGETITDNSYVFDNLLDAKYINLIKNKPLGVLKKGYIAISCDDGANALADTTIDVFKSYKTKYNKNISLTLGLMSSSQIFADNTRKAKVLDFINNYGSSVAIHGTEPYTTYSQHDLFEFLDNQKEFLTNNLIAPSSIIFPNHEYTDLSSAIAGTYYGVCATGGTKNPITYGGQAKCAGPRSNMYTIYRFSLFNDQMTLQKIKDAIDYAYENNMIFTPFFHDNSLANNYERNKALLDYCVDYANQKGLEFVNIGDIPNII